jgi:nitrogen fixation protein FixH
LGWQAKLHSPQKIENDAMASPQSARFIIAASPADLQLELNDQNGKPVQGAKVIVEAQSPGDKDFDFSTTFNAVSEGHYLGSLKFPRAGNWDLLIRAELDGRQFDMEQRVFVAIPKP